MPEILLLHEQTETIKRKVSLSCFRDVTVLTKFKLTVQLHFLLFLRISFGSFIHVSFQHKDVVLMIVLAGAGQLWATDVVLCRINLYVFTWFLCWLSTDLEPR